MQICMGINKEVVDTTLGFISSLRQFFYNILNFEFINKWQECFVTGNLLCNLLKINANYIIYTIMCTYTIQ